MRIEMIFGDNTSIFLSFCYEWNRLLVQELKEYGYEYSEGSLSI